MTTVGTNWVVTTLHGRVSRVGSAGGTSSAAQFNDPAGVAVGSAGNVYVAEAGANTIQKVTAVGRNWVVTTLAGTVGVWSGADGTGSKAQFCGPAGLAVDSAGNIYVADWGNTTIRKGYPALMMTSSGPTFGFNGGQFGFDLTGQAGKVVVVEGSTDLMSWLPLCTNTLAGPLNFSDPQSGVHSERFSISGRPMGILGDSRAWLSTVAVLHALAKGGTKPGGPDDGVSLGIPDDGHSRIGIEPRGEAKVGLFG